MTCVINCSTLTFCAPFFLYDHTHSTGFCPDLPLPPGGESFARLDSFHAPDLSIHPVLSRLQVVSAMAAHSAHHHPHSRSHYSCRRQARLWTTITLGEHWPFPSFLSSLSFVLHMCSGTAQLPHSHMPHTLALPLPSLTCYSPSPLSPLHIAFLSESMT